MTIFENRAEMPRVPAALAGETEKGGRFCGSKNVAGDVSP